MIDDNNDMIRGMKEAYEQGYKDAKGDATGIYPDADDEIMKHFWEEFLMKVLARLQFGK